MSKAIDPALFRETLGHYPTGVAVVTAVAKDGKPVGMVVGTLASVSLDPPLIAFFPASNSKSFSQLRTAGTFAVNVLAADQAQLCRRLATGGADKFGGVRWRPAPLGSPVLEGAVSWIECTFEQIREAGDHFIVLGRVHELAVERSTLPLLFFQGGYGQFSPGSFIAAPDPDLIQAAQLAATIRSQVEDLSTELAVNCSVLVKIGGDAVQVLAANQGSVAEALPLGHRQPIIPPFGANFMVNATPAQIEEWLRRAPDDSRIRRDLNRGLLDKVRERGYSVLTAEPELLQRHQEALSAFELSRRLPRHERAVQQATSELADHFCPDLLPGHRYDLASIVVPLSTRADLPPMAIQMSSLPASLETEQIESLTRRLQEAAVAAAAAMDRVRSVSPGVPLLAAENRSNSTAAPDRGATVSHGWSLAGSRRSRESRDVPGTGLVSGTAAGLGRGGMLRDYQERVKDAPPVRFGEVPTCRVRDSRQHVHELGGELVCIQIQRHRDGRDRLAISGGASEPNQRGGHLGRLCPPGLLTALVRFECDEQPHAQGIGEPGQRRGRWVAPAVLQVGDVGH
jgi:flavin reductase (DIM6/NTAB) family NADH-FMN oxidoreductase RutF